MTPNPLISLSGALVLLVAGAPAAFAQGESDLKALKAEAKDVKDWEGDYNATLNSWTFEKYVEVKVEGEDEPQRKPNRFYVDKLPGDAPSKAKEYAEKLKVKDFQDFGYVWTEITEVKELPDGWLILGLVKDYNDKEAKPEPGLVVLREIGGKKVRFKSGVLVNKELRDEMLALAKGAKI